MSNRVNNIAILIEGENSLVYCWASLPLPPPARLTAQACYASLKEQTHAVSLPAHRPVAHPKEEIIPYGKHATGLACYPLLAIHAAPRVGGAWGGLLQQVRFDALHAKALACLSPLGASDGADVDVPPDRRSAAAAPPGLEDAAAAASAARSAKRAASFFWRSFSRARSRNCRGHMGLSVPYKGVADTGRTGCGLHSSLNTPLRT